MPPITSKECLHCGLPFPALHSEIKRGGGKFCSPKCNYEYKKEHNPPISRFMAKVNKTKTCWVWLGALSNGYGVFPHDGERLAHRVSWIFHIGPIPEGKYVCHKCDNPPCVNPDHLFTGDNIDNMKDMVIKGRQGDHLTNAARGEKHGRAKVTNSEVTLIRQLYQSGLTTSELMEIYGLKRTSMRYLLRGTHWKSLPPI